jgi:hypothetical protein
VIASIIIGVTVSTLVLGTALWRAGKVYDRAERDPRYLRRIFVFFALLYIFNGVVIIIGVATGKESVWALAGFPIGLLMIWFFLRLAIKVKVPPKRPAQ